MPPILYLVRHGEAEHNVNHDPYTRDALLTKEGEMQCIKLKQEFPLHDQIDLLVSSPCRRAIQTSVLAFGESVNINGAGFHLLPETQEVSGMPCNVGFQRDELEMEVGKLFEQSERDLMASQIIDYGEVVNGWNSKKGMWGTTKNVVEKRAEKLRAWLYARPEKNIVLVTHGAFAHYLTEDWSEPIYFAGKLSTCQGTGPDFEPPRGTSYVNCEVRQFAFTPDSTEQEAHLVENEASKATRKGLGKVEEAF